MPPGWLGSLPGRRRPTTGEEAPVGRRQRSSFGFSPSQAKEQGLKPRETSSQKIDQALVSKQGSSLNRFFCRLVFFLREPPILSVRTNRALAVEPRCPTRDRPRGLAQIRTFDIL